MQSSCVKYFPKTLGAAATVLRCSHGAFAWGSPTHFIRNNLPARGHLPGHLPFTFLDIQDSSLHESVCDFHFYVLPGQFPFTFLDNQDSHLQESMSNFHFFIFYENHFLLPPFFFTIFYLFIIYRSSGTNRTKSVTIPSRKVWKWSNWMNCF